MPLRGRISVRTEHTPTSVVTVTLDQSKNGAASAKSSTSQNVLGTRQQRVSLFLDFRVELSASN